MDDVAVRAEEDVAVVRIVVAVRAEDVIDERVTSPLVVAVL